MVLRVIVPADCNTDNNRRRFEYCLTIDRNEVLELCHDLRHRWSFRRVLGPHAFNQIDHLRTPLLFQAVDRRSVFDQSDEGLTENPVNIPLTFGPDCFINGMFVHTLHNLFRIDSKDAVSDLTSQGNFLFGTCHCNISQ